MKKKVLLIDDSLTVQKVVALTLDRARYQVIYAKGRAEAMKLVTESVPDLILVSSQVPDIQAASFPKEVEVWLGRTTDIPPMILITTEEHKEAKHYVQTLRKPFSPQVLQTVVSQYTQSQSVGPEAGPPGEEFEERQLQKTFNDAFNDEATLVNETFKYQEEAGEHTQAIVISESENDDVEAQKWDGAAVPGPSTDLWNVTAKLGGPQPPPLKEGKKMVMNAEDSMAYKAHLEKKVTERIEKGDLDQIVEAALSRLLPPIVERLVQQRLDALLREQESFT